MGSNYTSGILSPVPNNRNGGSREVPNKMVVGGGGRSEKCSRSKVATRYH